MANRVFDDRLGLWIIDPARGVDRLPQIRAYGGGLIRDLFFPRQATSAQLAAARAAGFNAHLWVSVDHRSSAVMASETLADLDRLKPGALELNVELVSDAPLPAFVADVYQRIRSRRAYLRMRVNLGAWKAFAAPVAQLADDPNLYVCEQTYDGAMARYSEGDILTDLLDWGVPDDKATLCYGAAGPVPPAGTRVCTLPDLSRKHRGVIFHDDLMHDAGLI